MNCFEIHLRTPTHEQIEQVRKVSGKGQSSPPIKTVHSLYALQVIPDIPYLKLGKWDTIIVHKRSNIVVLKALKHNTAVPLKRNKDMNKRLVGEDVVIYITFKLSM